MQHLSLCHLDYDHELEQSMIILYHIWLLTSFFFQIVKSADFFIRSLWPPPKHLRGTLPFCLVGSRTQSWPQNGRSLPSRPWCSLRRAASTQWSKYTDIGMYTYSAIFLIRIQKKSTEITFLRELYCTRSRRINIIYDLWYTN